MQKLSVQMYIVNIMHMHDILVHQSHSQTNPKLVVAPALDASFH